ncbi:hypothetical protein DID80_06505 [Candidatus Marinamargulisbacteria bacterium SCGC AAA071-K20]|nr:hypothetical protein DID80_06505 [Candidatus Marinamargulisbacteria bacterium SCGC AAA071-K20]
MSKKESILLVDIGNSNTVLAELFDDKIGAELVVKTALFSTSWKSFDLEAFSRVIVSSVVPKVSDQLKDLTNVVFVTANNIPLISINMQSDSQIGADRLVNACAAYHHYPHPTLIIDSGTAITFCLIDEKGVYQGGAILPGMGISSKALEDYTEKIPYIEVQKQNVLLGKSTKEAVEVGLYNGYIYMINGFIKSFKAMHKNLFVLGTGKGLDVFKESLDVDVFDDRLILKGLQVISSHLKKGVKNNV